MALASPEPFTLSFPRSVICKPVIPKPYALQPVAPRPAQIVHCADDELLRRHSAYVNFKTK